MVDRRQMTDDRSQKKMKDERTKTKDIYDLRIKIYDFFIRFNL